MQRDKWAGGGTQSAPGHSISTTTRRRRMRTQALALGIATTALIAVGACNKKGMGANSAPKAQTEKAQKVAGTKTIAAGLTANSRFMATAKAAGLDQTLAGPGPYTVFV